MADTKEFIAPDFLQGQSVDEIHAAMMAILPDTIDKSEGQFAWEFTRPTANQKAELAGFTLMNAIQAIFPMWANGHLLDYHAGTRGMERRAAEYATGEIQITGIAGTIIPAGFIVATTSNYTQTSVSFRTTEEKTLAETVASIPIIAIDAGAIGNVAANTIILQDEPIKGIFSITNAHATSGGIDEESDQALRERIIAYDHTQGVSFCGSEADYMRWALEVPGVGTCKVYAPANEDETLTLIISDANGDPATTELCAEVSRHIMRPDNPSQRLAPVNSVFRVIPPSTITISITATVLLDGTATMDSVKADYLSRVKAYLKNAGSTVRYTAIGALILNCAGVVDYDKSTLLLNGDTANIAIEIGKVPVISLENIAFTEGSNG